MKICPQCTAGYPDSQTSCPTHGTLLSEIRDLKPGMIVHKTYKIVRKLGQGGMGAVYLAQHTLMDEPRALKFLSPELSADQDFTSRFLREVRTLRQVRNVNVVDCGDLESAEDDSLFFAMEFVDGPDLATFLRNAQRPFDVALALRFTRSISEGLSAAHAKGLVHRDIKPENILMAHSGETWVPKIADFGIVATRELANYTQTGSLLLTPFYAAPEQWRGMRASELDCRTDIYALGGVLYEMLTGQKAFHAEDYHGWAQQHLTAVPQPPSTLRPDLANWIGLDALVLCMLSKDREQRPKNIAEVLSLLDRILHVPSPDLRTGVKALSAEDPPYAARRVPAWAAWAALIASIAVVVIAAIVLTRVLASRSSNSLRKTTSPGTPTFQQPATPEVPAPTPPEVTQHKVQPQPRTGQNLKPATPKPESPIKNDTPPAQPPPANPTPRQPEADSAQKTAQEEKPTSAPIPPPTETKPVPTEIVKPRETSISEIENKARDLFDSGVYSDARTLFAQACNGGSMEACNYLGAIYFNGDGVPINYPQAAEFYSRSCNAGEETGCAELGYMYMNGFGVTRDYNQAFKLSTGACDAGKIIGCENEGVMFAQGAGVAKDEVHAVALWTRTCEAGMSRGCGNLGQMYLHGRGVRKNVDQGRDLFKKGCSLGDRRACQWLKEMH